MRRGLCACAAAGLWAIASDRAWAAHTPIANPLGPIAVSNVTVEAQAIVTGLNSPVHLGNAGDGSGRSFVVDQAGRISIIQNGVMLATPFLNVATPGALGSDTLIVGTGSERGLLGLAFHPDFDDPGAPGFGKLYTFTSVALQNNAATDYEDTLSNNLASSPRTNCQSVISEWTVSAGNPNQVDLSSRRELLRFDKPQSNHNGGMLEFGPDGYLYIGTGDGGSRDDGNTANNVGSGHATFGNAQATGAVLGKILRIDPIAPALTPGSVDPVSANGKYRNPIDNPYVGGGGAPEVFDIGIRNAFRFSHDALSGKFIVPDVGQDKVEEINVVNAGEPGRNFGWRIKEGGFLFDPNGTGAGFIYSENDPILPPGVLLGDLTDPVAEYDHDDGLAVIGGYVYRGTKLPYLEGKYIFGDFSSSATTPLGRLFMMDMDTYAISELKVGLDGLGYFIKGFGIDENGEIYILGALNNAFNSANTTGVVFLLVPEPINGGLAAVLGLAALRGRRVVKPRINGSVACVK